MTILGAGKASGKPTPYCEDTMGKRKKKIPDDFSINPQIEAAIRNRLVDGLLHCAQAFAIADSTGAPPSRVGLTADALDVRLDRCQLGLYGYPGHTKGWDVTDMSARAIPDGLEDAIRAAAGGDNHLTCAQAWEIAAAFGVPKMLVGYVTDKLDVRIAQCQLGAF